jgi:hypothetical protein
MALNVFHRLVVKKVDTSMAEKFSDFEDRALNMFGITDRKNHRIRVY